MLSSIPLLYKNNIFGFNPALKVEEPLGVLEKIDKHLNVLHHRNYQLRSAIMANSEKNILKRHQQFVTVLRSYVRLVIMDLHGTITEAMQFADGSDYMALRKETFEGYEELIVQSKLTYAEIQSQGKNFGRELFQMELKIKQYQKIEEKLLYPLYKEISLRD